MKVVAEFVFGLAIIALAAALTSLFIFGMVALVTSA